MQVATLSQEISPNENLLTAVRTTDSLGSSSLTQVVHSLETNNEFRDLLEGLKNSNQRLNQAKNDVSENKKLIAKRAIAITGIVLSGAILIAGLCLPMLLPAIVPVLAVLLGMLGSIFGGYAGVLGFSFWADELFGGQSLTPNAKRDLDFYSKQVETQTNQLKNIIRAQNQDRSTEFHDDILNVFLKNT